jgi:hypothetical protein
VRRSRSSRRRLSFLPREGVSGRGTFWGRKREPTVVALGNAVLDPATVTGVGDLGPVLVGVGRGGEGAASAVISE